VVGPAPVHAWLRRGAIGKAVPKGSRNRGRPREGRAPGSHGHACQARVADQAVVFGLAAKLLDA